MGVLSNQKKQSSRLIASWPAEWLDFPVGQGATGVTEAPGFGRQLLRNSAAILAFQVVSMILNFAVNLFLPRYLGPTVTGTIYFIASLTALIDLSHGLGHGMLLVKTIAREPHRAGQMLANALTIRLGMAILSLILLPIGLLLAGYDGTFVALAMIALLGTISLSLSDGIGSTYQGLNWMGLQSIFMIIARTSIAAATLTLVFGQRSVYEIVAVTFPIAIIQVVAMLWPLARAGHWLRRPDFAGIGQMMRQSVPFALFGASLIFYMQLNPILLGQFASKDDVAFYGLGLRLAGVMMIIPGNLITAAMPLLSRLWLGDRLAFFGHSRRLLVVLMIASTFPALLFWFFGHSLALVLYGPNFQAVGPVLQVWGLALIATYLNTFVGGLLAAMDRQRIWTVVMIVASVVALPVNIGLIIFTRDGGQASLGAAAGFFLSELMMTIPGFIILSRHQLGHLFLAVLARGAAATGVAALILHFLYELGSLSPWLCIPIAGVGYLLAAWLFRLVPHEELTIVRRLVDQYRHRFWPAHS